MQVLKLVGCERFGCPGVSKDTILKNDTIKVADPSIAASLLSMTKVDVANNSHPVWLDVTPESKAASVSPPKTVESSEDIGKVNATDLQKQAKKPRAKRSTKE